MTRSGAVVKWWSRQVQRESRHDSARAPESLAIIQYRLDRRGSQKMGGKLKGFLSPTTILGAAAVAPTIGRRRRRMQMSDRHDFCSWWPPRHSSVLSSNLIQLRVIISSEREMENLALGPQTGGSIWARMTHRDANAMADQSPNPISRLIDWPWRPGRPGLFLVVSFSGCQCVCECWRADTNRL